MLCFKPHILSRYYMPGQELHCSGILKTLFSFFKALHCCDCDKFVPFLISEFTDLGGDVGSCGFFSEGFGDDAGSFRGIWGFHCLSARLFAWAVPCDVALFVAFKAAAFFSIPFFVCFGNGFPGHHTGVHSIRVVWRELLSQRPSRVLRPLVLLLLSPTLLPEEGVAGSVLRWGRSGCSGPVFGSFKALNQNIIPLLCLGCLHPLFEALGLF